MTKEEFMAIASEHYEKVKDLTKDRDFYQAEQHLVQVIHEMGREVLEKSIGSVPDNRRKKKL